MTNKEQIRISYSTIAREYYELYKDDKSDLDYFDEFLSNCKNKILDLGCGMGHYSNYVHNKGFNVTGIDFAKGMIETAKKNYKGIEFIEADICDLSILGQKKYDGIVMAYIIQYLSKEEAENLFVNLNKYLEQDTNLLIFLREGNSIVEETETINTKYKYILKEYTKEEIRKLLEKNGWEIIKMETKGYVEDPNTLSPDTLVVIAKHK